MPGNVATPPQATPYPETEIEFLNAIMLNTGGPPSSSSGGGGGGSGSQNTVSAGNSPASSLVAAGAQSVLLIFSSDFSGTVQGATIDPAQSPSISFTASQGKTLPSINWTTLAGSITWFAQT